MKLPRHTRPWLCLPLAAAACVGHTSGAPGDAAAGSGSGGSGSANGATSSAAGGNGMDAAGGTSMDASGGMDSSASGLDSGEGTGAIDSGTTTGGDNGNSSGANSGGTTGASNDNSSGENGTDNTGVELPECSGLAAPTIPRLNVESLVNGLSRLVYAAQPPGSSDWYLVQQSGLIRVFTGGSPGALRAAPFFDATSLLGGSLGSYDERGLLGLAFHPDYASNGKAYIMLTTIDGDDHGVDKVLELTRESTYQASTSTKLILELPRSAANHNGGNLQFGPDGLLYVGTGDGGGACDSNQPNAPQDVASLFGKILRLDVNKSAPYAASSNPFTSNGDARVLHYGLRNPFRFSIDDATGDLYLGDVGQKQYEEIDIAPAGSSGLNFGWGAFEGPASPPSGCSGQRSLREGSTHTPPVFSADRYGSTSFSSYQSIIGGVVYRGMDLPSLKGIYFFGDYTSAYMGAVTRCQTGVSPARPIRTSCGVAESSCLDTKLVASLAAIVEGSDAEMYLVANNSLFKVTP